MAIAAPKPRLEPVTSAFLPFSWRDSKTMLALPSVDIIQVSRVLVNQPSMNAGGIEFGYQKLDGSQRQQIGKAGNQKRNHVAARPLQGVADDLGDQHSSDRTRHSTHSDDRADRLRRKSVRSEGK